MDKERLTLEIPYGMRDFLPVEAAEKRAIETELASLFAEWGYDEVVLLERRLELLLRLVGELVLVHDARDELDLAEADCEVREAGAQQALDGQRDDLGIGKGRR